MRTIRISSALALALVAAACSAQPRSTPRQPAAAHASPGPAPTGVMPDAPARVAIEIAWPKEPAPPGAAAPEASADELDPGRLVEIRDQLSKLQRAFDAQTDPGDRIDTGLRMADLLHEAGALASDADLRAAFRQRAAKLLALLAGRPTLANHPRADELLLRLAQALMPDDPAAARKTLHRLIKNYPSSKFVADAYLAFGEYFFEQGQLRQARTFYQKVIQLNDPRLSPYAIYKTAWVDMNLGDHARALEGFARLLGAPDVPSVENLKRQAAKDAVTAYSHIGRPDKAAPFFERVAGEQAVTLMAALARRYADHGKTDDAIALYEQMAERYAGDPEACHWQVDRSRLHVQLEDYGRATDAAAGALTLGAESSCRARARHHARALARARHDEHRETLQAEPADQAASLYAAVLRAGATKHVQEGAAGPTAARDRLYLADLAWGGAAELREPAAALDAWLDVSGGFAMAATELEDPDERALAEKAAKRALEHARAIRDAFGLPRTVPATPSPVDLTTQIR